MRSAGIWRWRARGTPFLLRGSQRTELLPIWDRDIISWRMRIISRKTLRLFWEKPEYADAEQPLKAWFREATNADWASPAAIKAAFGNASIVGNNRVVFNIGGNKYRLVVRVNYPYRVMYVRFVGSHAQYDRIKVEDI
jgi:mRNA interferase HigB